MSDWIHLPRLEPCPVAPDTRVRVLFRYEPEPIPSIHTYLAKQLRWDRFPGQKEPLPFDILGYRVEAA